MGHSFGLQPSSVAWSLRACFCMCYFVFCILYFYISVFFCIFVFLYFVFCVFTTRVFLMQRSNFPTGSSNTVALLSLSLPTRLSSHQTFPANFHIINMICTSIKVCRREIDLQLHSGLWISLSCTW